MRVNKEIFKNELDKYRILSCDEMKVILEHKRLRQKIESLRVKSTDEFKCFFNAVDSGNFELSESCKILQLHFDETIFNEKLRVSTTL